MGLSLKIIESVNTLSYGYSITETKESGFLFIASLICPEILRESSELPVEKIYL